MSLIARLKAAHDPTRFAALVLARGRVMSMIDELRAAHEAATPGPWNVDRNGHGDGYVARYDDPSFVYILKKLEYHDANVNPVADAELIVLLRNALPEIIAALEVCEQLIRHVDPDY